MLKHLEVLNIPENPATSLPNPDLNRSLGESLKNRVPLFIHNIGLTYLRKFDHILIHTMICEISSTNIGMISGANHI